MKSKTAIFFVVMTLAFWIYGMFWNVMKKKEEGKWTIISIKIIMKSLRRKLKGHTEISSVKVEKRVLIGVWPMTAAMKRMLNVMKNWPVGLKMKLKRAIMTIKQLSMKLKLTVNR